MEESVDKAKYDFKIDLSVFSSGTYILNLTSLDGANLSKLIVVQD